MGPTRRTVWLSLSLLTLVTVAAYLPTFWNESVQFDDGLYIGNQHVPEGLTWKNFLHAWTYTGDANWLPIVWLSLELDVSLFGFSPRTFHAMSLFWHVVNVCLLWWLLVVWTGRWVWGLLVALLFAVHPLHVESVAWISERKDVLSLFFALLCLLAYTRYAIRPTPLGYAAFFCAFLLGLMSKSMLVTMPVLLWLVDFWPLKRWRFQSGDRSTRPSGWLLLEKAPLLLASLVVGVITIHVQEDAGAVAEMEALPLSSRIANALVGYVWYLEKTVAPTGLTIFYPHPWAPRSLLSATGAGAILFACTAWACWAGRTRPATAMGWFWFLISLVPVIGLLQVGLQAYADRYSYLPHVGLLIALATEADALFARWPRGRSVGATMTVLIIGCFAVLTHQQVRVWRDTESLWRHALRVNDTNWMAQMQMGRFYLERFEAEQAEPHLLRAVELNPSAARPLSNLASLRLLQERWTEAARLLDQALKLNPEEQDALYKRAIVYRQQERFPQAVELLLRLWKLDPERADVAQDLGQLLLIQGDLTAARDWLERGVALDPDDAELRNLTALACVQVGDAPAAIRHLEAVAFRKETDADVLDNLASLLIEQGRPGEALKALDLAQQRDPQNLERAKQIEQLQLQSHDR